MARLSVKIRGQYRIDQTKLKKDVRSQLRADSKDENLDIQARMEASQKLQQMSRDSSPTRRRNRCNLCGRPRGYNRLTGLCRLHMRIAIISGMVPGMRKSSW